MARKANSSLLSLEEWLKGVSGSNVSGGLVKQNSSLSARSIIQAWSEIRESLQSHKFDTRYLQALRALVSSESTIHVADPQAKLLISILALREVSLSSESYTLVLRLLYVWIRKSVRPSQALVGSAVQAIRGVFDDRRNLQPQPALVAESVLVSVRRIEALELGIAVKAFGRRRVLTGGISRRICSCNACRNRLRVRLYEV